MDILRSAELCSDSLGILPKQKQKSCFCELSDGLSCQLLPAGYEGGLCDSQKMSLAVYNASGHSLSLKEAYASSQTMRGPVAKTLAIGPASIFLP